MQFSLPPLSLTPFAGTASVSVMNQQGLENYAETGAEQGGLFALILGQLDLRQPAATAPVVTGSGPVIAHLTTQIAATDLPPTGNPLPLVLPQASGQPLPPVLPVLPQASGQPLAPLKEVEAARPGDALLPLPVLPQPLQQPGAPAPAVVTTLRTSTSTVPAPAPAVLPSAPTAPQPVVTVRDTLIEPDALPAALPAADKLPALQTPEDFSTLRQNTTPSSPVVAPSPLNTAPAPAAPSPSTPPQHAYTLNQPVADPQWGNELGKRLIWMNEHGIGRAELRMNPPELGPVEVRIAVSNDDARVVFQAQHGATREALESAMPRLREMFAAQGLTLSDASVSEHSANGQRQTGESGQHGDNGFGELSSEMADAPEDVRATPLDGSIDTYV